MNININLTEKELAAVIETLAHAVCHADYEVEYSLIAGASILLGALGGAYKCKLLDNKARRRSEERNNV